MTKFSELKLHAPLAQALAAADYLEMTPVQAASLPAILAEQDVVAQAKTGSGKTVAFALALLTRIDATTSTVQGLVLCPTRELADQVSREIRKLACLIPNVKVLTLCGGVPVRIHLASLAHAPHIVVGTPGRILDLLERDALPLKTLRTLVLDEADRMLDMGFADDITEIITRAPTPRQTLLFSVTMPAPILAFSRQFQTDPVTVAVPSDTDEALIEQTFFEVRTENKPVALRSLLLAHRPLSVVVFCNTRDEVRAVTDALSQYRFAALALHGELEAREREEMLVRFANHSCHILVATDVAARGIDIKELTMVINFDLATDADTHLHRIGRTGRAGHHGVAFTLCTPQERGKAEFIGDRRGKALVWRDLPPASPNDATWTPHFTTLTVDAGRQDKLRPGDLLGALTGKTGLPSGAVGKIDVFPTRTYVAITHEWLERAVQGLRTGKIKGRSFRIRT